MALTISGGHAALIGTVAGVLQRYMKDAPLLRYVGHADTSTQSVFVCLNEGPTGEAWYAVQVVALDRPPEGVT